MDRRYGVRYLIAPGGERLPLLVHTTTELPCQLALRWLVQDRRGRVAAATLADDQRAVGSVYGWAEHALPMSLDAFLLAGHTLDAPQIAGLAKYVKTGGSLVLAGSIGTNAGSLAPLAFNQRWHKIRLFLRWAAERSAGSGAQQPKQQQAITAACERIDRLFGQHQVGTSVNQSLRLVSPVAWTQIQQIVALERADVWPDPSVRVRNQAMVYLAMNTGMRIGELLKLTLGQLPRGQERHVVVKRRPDDALDPRREEPQVKTNERELPVPNFLARMLATYATQYRPRSRSPYVFLAQGDRPLTSRQARRIPERISQISGLHVTWHVFRHTFCDTVYHVLADRPNGIDILQELAGWASPLSATPYVRHARQQHANAFLASYQEGLFPPPGTATVASASAPE